MTVALGTIFMVVGAVFGVLDLSAVVLASLLVVFIYIEIGSPYTWLVWLATSLASFLLYPGSMMWLVYLTVFGIFPIIKGYIERLPRFLWLILKLVFLNAMLALLVMFSEVLTGVSFFGDVSEIALLPANVAYVVLWVIMNLAFILYDMLIVVMVRFYEQKIRPRLKNLLK